MFVQICLREWSSFGLLYVYIYICAQTLHWHSVFSLFDSYLDISSYSSINRLSWHICMCVWLFSSASFFFLNLLLRWTQWFWKWESIKQRLKSPIQFSKEAVSECHVHEHVLYIFIHIASTDSDHESFAQFHCLLFWTQQSQHTNVWLVSDRLDSGTTEEQRKKVTHTKIK